MPIYEYEAEDGERRELFCLLSSRPDSFVEDGKEFKRIISAPMRLQTGIQELRDYYAPFREMQRSQGITEDRVESSVTI